VRLARPLVAATLALGVAVATACAAGDDGSSAALPTLATRTENATAGVRLVRVAGGLGDALYITGAPGEPNRLFVVQQSGRIRILDHGRLRRGAFLSVAGKITSGGERGLLGLAFHPGYAGNGRFFVNYTDRAGNTQVVEYRRASADRADPGSARRLLSIKQPFANHNGGDLVFGPDGLLYIGTGDGGSGGDPFGNGQRLNTLLGKLLRIDVDRSSGGRPYGIPSDNPYQGPGQRPEIYSYGLRNPWRFSFDRTRGDLWIGDVGQGAFEEVDYRPQGTGRGVNFGWNAFEGRSRYPGGGPVRGNRPVAPVAQYGHSAGCSITGGYVYRGRAVPALRGRYVYADYCSGRVWSMAAGPTPGRVREETAGLGARLGQVTSFGESLNGELYVIAGGTLYRFARR
jgi:glucose/arabinose dehydrogenase